MSSRLTTIACLVGLTIALWPAERPTAFLNDREVRIPRDVYEVMESLLETGSFHQGDVVIDASAVQTMRVEGGTLRFSPPVTVRWKFLKTTVDTMSADESGDGIFIEVNHSPIDVRILPED